MIPITLTLTFTASHAGTTVAWEADVLGMRTSQFIVPYDHELLPLVVRALDVLQFPNYPTPFSPEQDQLFSFSADAQHRLITLGLWDIAGRVRANAHQCVGRALYHALTADADGMQALATVRDHATAADRPVMLRFCFPPQAVELAALPWELLWDDGPVPLIFSRGRVAVCTRHINLAQAFPPGRPLQLPLRILAIAPHAGMPASIRQEERNARMQAWQPLLERNQVVMHEVSPATPMAVAEAIQRHPPDIVHYYGHGRSTKGEGALLFDARGGGSSWISALRMMTLLGNARLVVLHACRGAMVGGNDLLTGIAPALSAAGVPLVIAMQQTIRVEAATRLSGSIYHALVEGRSVQEAVSQARQALFVEEDDQISWYVPTLYMRSRDPGPIYLISPSAETDPSGSVTAVPPTTKAIIARKQSAVSDITMSGGDRSQQSIHASNRSQVARVITSAGPGSQHCIEASDESTITDVQLDDRSEQS